MVGGALLPAGSPTDDQEIGAKVVVLQAVAPPLGFSLRSLLATTAILIALILAKSADVGFDQSPEAGEQLLPVASVQQLID